MTYYSVQIIIYLSTGAYDPPTRPDASPIPSWLGVRPRSPLIITDLSLRPLKKASMSHTLQSF